MFDDIGQKIKNFAKISYYIFAAIYILGGVIAALIMLFEDIFISLIIVGGVVVAIFINWIFFALLYAFGELVDNSAKIANSSVPIKNGQAARTPNQNAGHGNDIKSIMKKANDFLNKPLGPSPKPVPEFNAAAKKLSATLDIRITLPEASEPKCFSGKAALSDTSVSFISNDKKNYFSVDYSDIYESRLIDSALIIFSDDGEISLKGQDECLRTIYEIIKS